MRYRDTSDKALLRTCLYFCVYDRLAGCMIAGRVNEIIEDILRLKTSLGARIANQKVFL